MHSLMAMAGLLGSGWPGTARSVTSGGHVMLGNCHVTKASRKADAKRRHRANVRLRKGRGAPTERGATRSRAKPAGAKAARKARAGQLGVTRRGF
ncbi:hypothetical protein T31B1_14489 [Salinisphaera sp. T31B1]